MASTLKPGGDAPGATTRVVDLGGLDALLATVAAAGFTVVGPTPRDGVIAYDEIESVADLPRGWTDEQEAGSYTLHRRGDDKVFGYAAGPHSWKSYLFPARSRVFAADLAADGTFAVDGGDAAAPRYAFVGVRACETSPRSSRTSSA